MMMTLKKERESLLCDQRGNKQSAVHLNYTEKRTRKRRVDKRRRGRRRKKVSHKGATTKELLRHI